VRALEWRRFGFGIANSFHTNSPPGSFPRQARAVS
jgi:hypothetical protein